jgi:hypothetical protein
MGEFNREELEFYLSNKTFKGLSKNYILEAVFNDDIQKNWRPQVGDIIVGCTGNIFVISGMDRLHESIGGTTYYFGGSSCSRDGSGILDDTYCFTANESGKYFHPLKGEQENSYHSSIRDFRYVPYPHERNDKKPKKITFESINEGNYEIIPPEKMLESRVRIAENMRKIFKNFKRNKVKKI